MNNLDISAILPCLNEKFIVDFANGIDVVEDQIKYQRQRSGFFNRIYDGLTGKDHSLNHQINLNLANGVESSLTWLTELTNSLAKSNYAQIKANERIIVIQKNIANLADHTVEIKSYLREFEVNVNNDIKHINDNLHRLDLKVEAEFQLNLMLYKWKNGDYNAFSLAGRLYAVLEELRWGKFGDYCRIHPGDRHTFIDYLTRRASDQLYADLKLDKHELPIVSLWLSPPAEAIPEAREALAYLGDWSKPESHPFVYSTTQAPAKPLNQLPLYMPRLCRAERVAQALISEVFEEH